MSDIWLSELAGAIRDTLVMVGVSAVIALLVGIPLALVLVTTTRGGIFERRSVNTTLVGTTIGVWAAIVPLSIAAIPFFARVAEVSLREVDRGLIEAAQAMGAQRRHIIWHVLLPEALPGILGGFTITIVAMIGSSAMAGAVGAGGLGDLAIRYGYQRFDTTVMVTVIVLLIVIVTAVQFVGDRFVRRLGHRA
jgi:D-methionine transport system permease protein